MKDNKLNIAAERYQMIALAVQDGLDHASEVKFRKEIVEKTGISDRTLRRYISAFQKNGLEGLIPKHPSHARPRSIDDKVVQMAIQLRREVPGRSIQTIITILENEGVVVKGELKRSTLQEHLSKQGFSSRLMRMYGESGVAARRFQQRHRNDLWQSDIKYGPYLPIGQNGKNKQVYFVAIIDDATRFIVHGAFYDTLDQRIVEDSLRSAIHTYGVPKALYFDNGLQFKNKWSMRMCSQLGIRLLFTKAYSPESKGKIERFNRTLDSFIAEVNIHNIQTLQELNTHFDRWLELTYHNRPHAGLSDGKSPLIAYNNDKTPLRLIDIEELNTAFKHTVIRKVDKSGCISFQNQKYEVGVNWIGQQVTVLYDALDISELIVEPENFLAFKVVPLNIGTHAASRPKLPETMQSQPVKTSRLLDSFANMEITGEHAISYEKYASGGKS
ncbi:MAG: DDE-type integrase/transposase/recombinase [Bacilli bacterium]